MANQNNSNEGSAVSNSLKIVLIFEFKHTSAGPVNIPQARPPNTTMSITVNAATTQSEKENSSDILASTPPTFNGHQNHQNHQNHQGRQSDEPSQHFQVQENGERIGSQTAEPSNQPMWSINRRHNEQKSKLYSLPSEILLNMIGQADFLSQQMFRQTCSRFAELVSSTDSKLAEKPLDTTFGFRQIWPCHGTPEQRLMIIKEWKALILRDVTDLCKNCRAFEESGLLAQRHEKLKETLWCDYCKKYHVRGMFTPSQRHRKWFWWQRRKCIGWEGRLRLCPHVSYSWSDFAVDRRRLAARRRQGIAEVHAVRCPQNCHWPGSYNSLGSGEQTPCTLEKPYYSWVVNQKQLDVVVPEIAATWASHVFDIDPAQPPTRQTFRDAWNRIDASNGGPYMCPHMDEDLLFLPLEPGYCSCFSDQLEPGYKVPQHKHLNTCGIQCRCYKEKFLTKEQSGTVLDAYYGHFTHLVVCPECDALYFWRRQGNSIHIEFATCISASSASGDEWIRKLDPHSWNITDDFETRHVHWCPDAGCRTNYRWAAMYRHLGR